MTKIPNFKMAAYAEKLQVELAEQTEALTDVAGTVKNVQAQSTFKV
jgi:hypothetical protein